ncbi:MAG: choice-of-anchor X domain-containing protein, partial [Chloroflexota bacterium]
ILLMSLTQGLVSAEVTAVPTDLVAKQLAGAPEEIANVSLPAAESIVNQSQHAIVSVDLANKSTWTGTIDVDDADTTTLVLLAPDGAVWQTAVSLPSGRQVDLEDEATVTSSTFGFEETQHPSKVYQLTNGENGRWEVAISTSENTLAKADDAVSQTGYLIVASESPYQINTHFTSMELLTNRTIGINAFISKGELAEVSDAVVTEATIEIAMGNGLTQVQMMADDGLSDDGLAQDGRFGVQLANLSAGQYSAQVTMRGETAEGRPFSRTSELLFPVIEPAYELTGAETTLNGRQRLGINLLATTNSDSSPKVFAFAELWGTNTVGEMVPAAWVGGMTQPQIDAKSGVASFALELDARWLARAEVVAPFELRNGRLQDATTYIPISQLAQTSIDISRRLNIRTNGSLEIDDAMRMGQRPALDGAQPAQRSQSASDGLLLVHGYCSDLMWPAGNFNDGPTHVFSDTSQNRTHDAFAQLIKQQGDAAFSNSYSIVAHSQGGAATLHLYTNYWSGLDYSNAQRLIQSVGTPYQGTTLAGSLAWIGDIFGQGCGTNFDLTHEGASLWLSTVPSWARSKVNYYTTSHKDSWWPWQNLCHATSYVIGGLDDGVVAKSKGQLSGGHNRGHSNSQCHTTGMVYNAQYHDSGRNATMDNYARP